MCSNPVDQLVEYSRNGSKYTRIIKRPCNECQACRIDKLLLWQSRCNSEYVKYRSAFVTFTFDENHLIYNKNTLHPTLSKELVHKYFDNIRHQVKKLPILPKSCTKNYHYFAASEYGDKFKRPHTHCLFFGLDFKDCENIFNISWKNGFTKTLPILNGGIRYVIDYLTKQITGDKAVELYDNNNIERPFKQNSQGIGLDTFLAHREEIADTSCIMFGSRKVPVPTYYVNLMRSFSIDNVSSVYKNRVSAFRDLNKRILSEGFSDYDSWLRYTAKAKEERLASFAVSHGKAADPNYYGKSFYDSKLASLALA